MKKKTTKNEKMQKRDNLSPAWFWQYYFKGEMAKPTMTKHDKKMKKMKKHDEKMKQMQKRENFTWPHKKMKQNANTAISYQSTIVIFVCQMNCAIGSNSLSMMILLDQTTRLQHLNNTTCCVH